MLQYWYLKWLPPTNEGQTRSRTNTQTRNRYQERRPMNLIRSSSQPRYRKSQLRNSRLISFKNPPAIPSHLDKDEARRCTQGYPRERTILLRKSKSIRGIGQRIISLTVLYHRSTVSERVEGLLAPAPNNNPT